jgi:hypothetical protein
MLKAHLFNLDLDYMIPKGISQTSIPKSQIYTIEKEITKQGAIFVVLKYESSVGLSVLL